ncbi:MAG TPA: KUP/HAK/KT family potassium transporter [Trebonia sp.]|nr:KUP/HAK/KT family potassium transporter [Trebonia sp.]
MARQARQEGTGQAALALGALGVVFGDIGTSPLYTVQTVFDPTDPHRVRVSTDSVFGVTSLIFWSGMLIVTVTYVLLVMRADNDGEGGIMALITLIRKMGGASGRRIQVFLAMLGVFGASLFFGDSMITPAISVLSAVSGVEIVSPSVTHLVVPITALIILGLFFIQRLGTGAVGGFFGPVMVVWFTVIALLGIHGIIGHPAILKALSPTYAIGFLAGHFTTAFFSLAAVVLAVTGAEALYADMGHFGRRPITIMWLMLVFPACTLSYLGQGALVLGNPASAIANPFFLLVPGWGRIPMVILATAATVIASQAVISGAYSLTQQAAQLGYLPRLRIDHTSEEQVGQIYVPWINWALLVAVLALVFIFKSSNALAYAYGMAVTCTITCTTLLFFYIARSKWHQPLWLLIPAASLLLLVDLAFVAVNLTKFVRGAWLPLLVGLLVFTVLITWQKGRHIVTRLRQQDEGSLLELVNELHSKQPPLARVPGTAVFLNRGKETAPLALRANVEHNHVLHERVIILSIETVPRPHVPESQRIADVDDLGYTDDMIAHVTVKFGYMDTPNVPALLPLMNQAELKGCVEAGEVSYFLSKLDLHIGQEPGLNVWRKRLFLATSRLTADAAEYFQLPRDRTVIMGARVDI